MSDKIGDVLSFRHHLRVGGGRIESDYDCARLQFRNDILGDPADQSIGNGENHSLCSVERLLERRGFDAASGHFLLALWARLHVGDIIL